MDRPHNVAPDRLLRDGRRNAWILVLPAADFLGEPYAGDCEPPSSWRRSCSLIRQGSQSRAVTPGLMERVLPFVMLVWATVVWSFLFYELGHL